jgi:hypothetical protein
MMENTSARFPDALACDRGFPGKMADQATRVGRMG